MTYAAFLLLFLVPPIVALAVAVRRRVTHLWALGVLGLMALALLYTGPWDHLIIAQGVWSYPPGAVLGPRLGLVPLEEYVFYLLQVLLTGLTPLVFVPRAPQPPPR
jgi:lycopene cyclase domain-containing protein